MKNSPKKQSEQVAKAQVRDERPAAKRVIRWTVDACYGPQLTDGSTTYQSMLVGIADAMTLEVLHTEALLCSSPWSFAKTFEVLTKRHGLPATVELDHSLWLIRQIGEVCASKGTRIEPKSRWRSETANAMEGWFRFAHESMSPQSSSGLDGLNRQLQFQRERWNVSRRRPRSMSGHQGGSHDQEQ